MIIKVFMPIKKYPRYTEWLPTLPLFYDNSEISSVQKHVQERTSDDESFFFMTDPSVVHAFSNSPKEKRELTRIITHPLAMFVVYLLKYTINRPRPYQLSPKIKTKTLESKTGNSPACPAGHAYQAYLLAAYLSRRRPEMAGTYNAIARRCDMVRVKAGIHYPKDGVLGKRLVDMSKNIIFKIIDFIS